MFFKHYKLFKYQSSLTAVQEQAADLIQEL